MFVEIDGSTMRFSRCDAFEYKGSHSGETRRGMEMVFTSYSNSDNEQIEALLRNREVVTVADPVARRKYEAKIDRSWSSSYQEGRPTKSYQFTLREIDRAKAFPSLQIEGETFAVLRNTETDRGDGGVIAHVLLRLSPEEFETFHSLIKPGTVQILRQGVDDEPVERRFGRVASWSRHEEDSQTYYKQVVNFYDLETIKQGPRYPPRNRTSGLVADGCGIDSAFYGTP